MGTDSLCTLRDWLQADRRKRKGALELCLRRVREMDGRIHAWVRVAPQVPTGDGELAGIPFGAKDVFETEDVTTEFGSPVYKGRKGTADAALIRELRKRGAVLLGKTETAEFGYCVPPRTRNPRNVKHTPGGSSSGSAAAVAAGMVPLAVGAQTYGSILRPASYCGVTGFKPTYGLLSTQGMLAMSMSLDTVGFFTHGARDMQLLWSCLGNSPATSDKFCLGVPDSLLNVSREMRKAFERCVAALQAAGHEIRSVTIEHLLEVVRVASGLVMNYEGARAHSERVAQHGARLGPIVDLVRRGMSIREEQYNCAKESISHSRQQITQAFAVTPVILTPAATRSAPRGLASTGDPAMNTPWTALGTPAISIPMPVGRGLPLGLQLTADRGQDASLLQAAVRLELALQKSSPRKWTLWSRD